jgi:hypothetical protein
MAGRRSKYTPETVDKLTQAIRLGATDELACNYAGIDGSTFYEWMNAKAEFSETIKQAKGAAAVKWLAKIEQAGEEAWQAFAWKLERRYPEMYGRNRVELTGANGGPVQVETRNLPPLPEDTIDDILAE